MKTIFSILFFLGIAVSVSGQQVSQLDQSFRKGQVKWLKKHGMTDSIYTELDKFDQLILEDILKRRRKGNILIISGSIVLPASPIVSIAILVAYFYNGDVVPGVDEDPVAVILGGGILTLITGTALLVGGIKVKKKAKNMLSELIVGKFESSKNQ